MSMLDQLLSRKHIDLHENWKELTLSDQLEEIVALSQDRFVVIFKHSVRCGISAMAKYQLENNWPFSPDQVEMYYLDIINHRQVSNEVRDAWSIVHHSPQIIIIHQGDVVYHTSHHMISVEAIQQAIATAAT